MVLEGGVLKVVDGLGLNQSLLELLGERCGHLKDVWPYLRITAST